MRDSLQAQRRFPKFSNPLPKGRDVFGTEIRMETEGRFQFVNGFGSDPSREDLMQSYEDVVVPLHPSDAILNGDPHPLSIFERTESPQRRNISPTRFDRHPDSPPSLTHKSIDPSQEAFLSSPPWDLQFQCGDFRSAAIDVRRPFQLTSLRMTASERIGNNSNKPENPGFVSLVPHSRPDGPVWRRCPHFESGTSPAGE